MKDMKDFNKEIIVKPRIRPIRPHIKIKPQIDNNFIKSQTNTNTESYENFIIYLLKSTFFAPGVQILTATHPTDPIQRRKTEYGKPIRIGKDCWIGGNAIICPGVTIGDGCTIGAGSVVTKDIPANSLAVGNPAKVIRKLNE